MIDKLLHGRVVGIAGPSCCGKSTIANSLADVISGAHAPMHLDEFWISGGDQPIVNGEPSYERANQYDGAKLLRLVNYERGIYDPFTTTPNFSIIEGFVLFLYPDLFRRLDTKIYLKLTEEEMVRRRAARVGSGGNPINGGGKRDAIERAFIANGVEEWRVNGGPEQEFMDGVHVVDASRPVEEVFCDVLGIIMCDALADRRAD